MNKPQETEPIKNPKDIIKIRQYLQGKPNKRDYTIFVLGINVGLRAGDLLQLKVGDIMEGKKIKNEVTIQEEKTDKTRTLALNKNAKDAIKLYLDTLPSYSEDDYLFASRKGSGHLQVRPLHHIIKSTLRDLGIKGNYGTHSLRKTFAYHRYVNGVPLEVIQKMLNHSSSAVTLRYIGITKEVLVDAYNAVNL